MSGSVPATPRTDGRNCAATRWRTPGAWRPCADPRSGAGHDRQHRLRGDLATHRHNGRDMEQWEYEVTSGGRVRYAIDDGNRTVWLIYASPRHPKDTDRLGSEPAITSVQTIHFLTASSRARSGWQADPD